MRKYKYIGFFDYAQVCEGRKMALCAGISKKMPVMLLTGIVFIMN